MLLCYVRIPNVILRTVGTVIIQNMINMFFDTHIIIYCSNIFIFYNVKWNKKQTFSHRDVCGP